MEKDKAFRAYQKDALYYLSQMAGETDNIEVKKQICDIKILLRALKQDGGGEQ